MGLNERRLKKIYNTKWYKKVIKKAKRWEDFIKLLSNKHSYDKAFGAVNFLLHIVIAQRRYMN